MEKILEKKLKLFNFNSVLDVGPGFKNYFAQYPDVKRDIIEGDKEVIQFQEELGVRNVFQIDLNGSYEDSISEKYDLIVLFEVLEHLEDPVITLMRLKRLLNPGGTIMLSVPTAYSEKIMFKLNNKYNKDTLFPHVNFFTKKAILSLMKVIDCDVLLFHTINLNYLVYHIFLHLFKLNHDVSTGKVDSLASKIAHFIMVRLSQKYLYRGNWWFGRNYFLAIR
jgi:2-polyprenyl-3-methyl-5-hydroxy-6-metoxy-1,4-benzoquinol methylase